MTKKLLGALIALLLMLALVPASPASAADRNAVPGEPGCYGALWWKNCNGRDMYRSVYNSTKNPTVANVRAAMLGAYAPVQKADPWNNQLKGTVELNYSRVTSAGKARCYRTATLDFIRSNTKAGKVTAEAVTVTKAAFSLYKYAVPPGAFRIGVSQLTKQYGKVLDKARTYAISQSAYYAAVGGFADCMYVR